MQMVILKYGELLSHASTHSRFLSAKLLLKLGGGANYLNFCDRLLWINY